MQRAQAAGHARSIGVSNYSVAEVDELRGVADVLPVVNQVQFSPFEYRRGLLEASEERGIALEAYSPLGTGRHLDDPRVRAVADRVGRTPAQVLIRWCLQRDLVVLPKSTHRERLEENARRLRLRPLRRGHGRARRARRDRRHRQGSREPLVVSGGGGFDRAAA